MPGQRSYFNAMAKCEALTVKQAGRFRDDEARGRINPRKLIKGFQKYLRTVASYVLRVIVRACEREEIPPPLNGSDWLDPSTVKLMFTLTNTDGTNAMTILSGPHSFLEDFD